LNGVTELGITKIDILDTFNKIQVCVAYEGTDGVDMTELAQAKPVYKTFPGWKTSTMGSTSYESLPQEAKEYLAFIEQETGVPITFISTGPKRDEMIIKK
jgi:adenylosuccinate synthase